MRPSWLWLCLLLVARPSAAQERWKVTLQDSTTYWDVHLLRVEADVVVILGDSLRRVPIADLREVRRFVKTTLQLGTGGVRSAQAGTDDEIYHLDRLDVTERWALLRKLLLYYPDTTTTRP